ncbi:MAG: hypothetical protein JJ916_05830 [Phycisphaerales bacterium]|nr:hypothetical protein [Phycisphaerales bacterium]
MNKVITAAAIAGCASIAAAQNFSLSLVPSTQTVDTSGGPATFTVTVFGDADVGTHLLGGAFALETNSTCVIDMSWQNSAWSAFNTDGGYAGNGNYDQIVFGQLVIPGIFPPAPGSELGSAIGLFVVTVDGGNSGPLYMQLVAGSPFTLETVDDVTGLTFQNSSGTLSLGTTTVFACIPTPGACSALMIAGLATSRHRR